jgi:DNA-binding NtrC family response regulator
MASPTRVLIVDDEPFITSALQRVLLRERFEVAVAGSAEEALGRLDEFEADAIITDHFMSGLTGLELLSRVAVERPGVVRLMMSATPESVEAGHAAVQARFDKPWDAPSLVATLRALVASRRGAARPGLA